MKKAFTAKAAAFCLLLSLLACNLITAAPQPAPPTAARVATELFIPPPAAAPVTPSEPGFFVALDGDDGSPGTFDQPWRTIQHAADVLNPGETVYLRAGTYSENVILRRSGAPGAPISFAVYPGEAVILDGGGSLSSAFETDFSEPDPRASDISISGFTIQNYVSFGIVGWSVNDRMTFTDLVIQHNGSEGLRLSNSDGSRVENVLLQNNEGGFDCTPILPGAETDTGCTNLYIADTQAIDNGTLGDTGTDSFAVERGDHILVERSTASGGVGDGFDFKSDHTTLSQVIAHDTRNNIKMWGKDSLLVDALAYDAYADANLVLTAGGSYTVINATIANMAGTAYLAVAADTSGSGSTPLSIYNSIFYNDNPLMEGTLLYFGQEAETPTLSHNLFFNPYRTDAVICADFAPLSGVCFSDADINSGAGMWKDNLYADPLFADAAARDYQLTVNSPACDAGLSDVAGLPTFDLAGNARVSGVGVDLGAMESR